MFLGEAVLNESGDSAALHRAVAEIFALAGQIGSDVFATFLVKQVIQNMAETTSPQRLATCAWCQHTDLQPVLMGLVSPMNPYSALETI